MMRLPRVGALAAASRRWRSAVATPPPAGGGVRRLVYQSQSDDVFTNLALEDWMYRHWSFDERRVLLLWRNAPCVVVGRHQNPWAEADLTYLSRHGIRLARRHSGGGTVYHDLGNLNCTFFTTRSEYDRRRNLDLICRALSGRWPSLDVGVSTREDLVLDGSLKVSGTAAKLGGRSAYHHCTLLVAADAPHLRRALKAPHLGMESKATASVRSPVTDLSSRDSSIGIEAVSRLIGGAFLDADATGSTGGHVEVVEPTEDNFPGLDAIRRELIGWEWIYGKTPKFTIRWPLAEDGRRLLELDVQRGVVAEAAVTGIGAEAGDPRLADWFAKRKLDDMLHDQLLRDPLVETLNAATVSSLSQLLWPLCARC